MRKRANDQKLAALAAVRANPDAAAVRQQLRTALLDRSNYVVGRAAQLAVELQTADLLPELLAAFDRFFDDPVKSDPQCLAKNALALALRDLGHRDGSTFVRGIRHFQFEPAWGGRADSAATLRATCALALPDCLLDGLEALTCLVDGLVDPDGMVRSNSAVAIAQLGRPEGVLLLRLKILVGDPEPAVTGQCFSALLDLAPPDAVAFVGRFLHSDDDAVQLEAASALAQANDPHAIALLEEFWQDLRLSFETRRALLINLGAARLDEAAAFLLAVVAHDPPELAAVAVGALTAGRFGAKLRERIAALVCERGLNILSRP